MCSPINSGRWILNRPGIGAGPVVLAALLLFLTPGANLAADPRLQILKTPDGIRFGLIGAKPAAPSPTVFFLGGGVEDSLSEPQYIEAQNEFGPGVLHVTIDLPGHGAERREGQPASLRGWRYRLDQGENLVAGVVRRATAVLDHLVRERYTDPAKVGAFGTSRGGFMAFHFAAAEPRIRHIAAFAPVTDLLALGEFFGMPNDHRARAIAATSLAGRLADRGIWIIIG
ncbi:MAG: prolyl oligopeptidase family serine peptidase, partial [Bryobacteraceae bacterium]